LRDVDGGWPLAYAFLELLRLRRLAGVDGVRAFADTAWFGGNKLDTLLLVKSVKAPE